MAKKVSKAERAVVAVRDALAPFGFPTAPGPGLCFRAEDDAQLARGFPSLRVLVDGDAAEAKASIAEAEKALDSLDRVLRLRVPRELARQYLLGYAVGPNLFASESPGLRAQRAERMRSDGAVDLALLEETLERQCREMGDTYAWWRTAEVLYLHEGFLGTEVVARAVVRHLLRLASERRLWGNAGSDPFRANAAGHWLGLAAVPLLKRLPGEVSAELRAMLGTVTRPEEVPDGNPRAYFALLHAIARPEAEPHESGMGLAVPLAFAEQSTRFLDGYLDAVQHGLMWNIASVCWLLGTGRLGGKLDVTGHDLVRIVDELAVIRDPGVVRLMARIASHRTARTDAVAWLREHAAYVRPILASLAKVEDPKEKSLAESALEAIGLADGPAPARRLSPGEVDAEVAKIFAELGATLARAKKKDAQLAAIREAYERYAEARAAGGDPIPEAYFTHRLGDFGLGEWGLIAIDAIE